MRAFTNALYILLTVAVGAVACVGPSGGGDVFGGQPGDCGPGRYWSDKDKQCLPNPADAGSDSGSSGAAGGGGSGGSAGASGAGGISGAGGGTAGTGGASGSGGSAGGLGSGGSNGVGGSPPDSGKPDGAPPNCQPPDKNDVVKVTVKISFTTNDLPLTLWHNFDGKWDPTSYTTEIVVVEAYTGPGLHKLNALLKGNRWLVEGSPSLKLSVPTSAIEVWFGCVKAPAVYQIGGNGTMPPNSVGFGWRVGDQGPNLEFCSAAAGCAYQAY